MSPSRPTRSNQKPNYGIDAPGLQRQFLIFGGVATVMMIIVLAIEGLPTYLQRGTALVSGLVAVYLFFMASLMWYSSRIWKVRNLQRMFGHLPEFQPNRILDVGCGRGMMAIEAARHYPDASVTGVDIWSSVDQSGNTPDTCLENSRLAGVEERVDVQTGDARDLPFKDSTFDLVVSHWVLHNLPSAADRKKAIEEINRVLADQGCLLLVDIDCIEEYWNSLTDLDWQPLQCIGPNAFERFAGRMSFGSFRPTAIVGVRPTSAGSLDKNLA